MSFDRPTRRTSLLGLFALAGCGFAPIYGEDAALHGQVAYETDETVDGFRIRSQLERRLGVAAQPRYLLKITKTEERQTSAITSDGDTTRFNVIGTARWVLTDSGTGQEVDRGTVQAFTGYATTGSTTATQAAETDAAARLSVILADRVVSQLMILSLDLPA
ncbi:LPS assembly lipoprotein LptE [Yoonia sp. BS5-3]|uniref:LPS assembly lipoprotein LptE n=1 Tax=Yoonia phaeophyticola TaxID=3137369 RepID=A0ABZ2V7I4_9RHOB